MLSLVVLLIGAAVLGVARGGSLESLAQTSLKWVWLVFAGLALQLAAELADPGRLDPAMARRIALWANALIVLFLVLNRRLRGVPLAGAGMLLNLIVITANGAMPVSVEAAEIAGVPAPSLHADIQHEPLDDDTLLPWLGDTVPLPGLRSVLSVGDIVLYLGLVRLVYARTTASRRDDRHRVHR